MGGEEAEMEEWNRDRGEERDIPSGNMGKRCPEN